MLRRLERRELGASSPLQLQCFVRASRAKRLGLSKCKEIVSSHKSGVNCLQADVVESRYLLAGASDGSIALYDTLQATCFDEKTHVDKHESLFTIGKSVKRGHQFAVSCVQWYPVDNGLFASGSFDQKIKLWDTNAIEVVLQFKFSGKVYAAAMSTLAASHALLAAGTDDPCVRLCDVSSGAFTHTLSGHREGVWALQWSASSEWVLFSGGCDGAIRVWDIRRAGCLRVLDQYRTQSGRRPPLWKKSTTGLSRLLCSPDLEQQSLSRMPGFSDNTIRRPRVREMEAQRQHSGMRPVTDRATGHGGAVVALQTTSDGFNLLSAGTDSRVRLWDLDSTCNTLVNYERTYITPRKGIQMAVDRDASLVFVPKASMIQSHDIWTGKPQTTLRGHYDQVNCCVFGFEDQELFTGGSDHQILVWNPPSEMSSEDCRDGLKSGGHPDEDAWSD